MKAFADFPDLPVKNDHQEADEHREPADDRALYRTSFHCVYYARFSRNRPCGLAAFFFDSLNPEL